MLDLIFFGLQGGKTHSSHWTSITSLSSRPGCSSTIENSLMWVPPNLKVLMLQKTRCCKISHMFNSQYLIQGWPHFRVAGRKTSSKNLVGTKICDLKNTAGLTWDSGNEFCSFSFLGFPKRNDFVPSLWMVFGFWMVRTIWNPNFQNGSSKLGHLIYKC